MSRSDQDNFDDESIKQIYVNTLASSGFFKHRTAFLTLFWLMLIGSCIYVGQYDDTDKWSRPSSYFREELYKQFVQTQRSSIPVKDLTYFKWDKICYDFSDTWKKYYLRFVDVPDFSPHYVVVDLDSTKHLHFISPSSSPPSKECFSYDRALFKKEGDYFLLTTQE